jgi:hypothetical protein
MLVVEAGSASVFGAGSAPVVGQPSLAAIPVAS